MKLFRHWWNYFPFVYLFMLALFLCCVANACQQAVDVELSLPHEEKIVVRGVLLAGELLSDVQISRTLPPLDVFSYEKIFVSDARVLIATNASVSMNGSANSNAFSLSLQSVPSGTRTPRSLYEARGVRVVGGVVYALEVSWNGKTARATTRVPFAPEIFSTRLLVNVVPSQTTNQSTNAVDTVVTVEATIQARAGAVYRIGAEMSGSTTATRAAGDVFRVMSDGEALTIKTEVWRGVAKFLSQPTTRVNAVVQVSDAEFYEYYLTRNRGGQPDILNPSGPNVEWNVTGEGLGMFVGTAVGRREVRW